MQHFSQFIGGAWPKWPNCKYTTVSPHFPSPPLRSRPLYCG